MKLRLSAILFAAGLVLAALPLFAAEATFERSLTFSGRADLSISTGSGKIHLTAGPAGQVHVVGHIHSNWGGSDDRVRELAARPPVEQTGNIIRIGVHSGNLNNISIDYEVQAPADAYLEATTGSGEINVDGVGTNPHLNTGSGSIHATGLRGNTKLGTGSGSIHAEFAGNADVQAEAGSGSIELRNIQGGLQAHTGSGGINVGGMPTSAWQIHTGSGSVDFWSGNSAFTIAAQCGAGGIHSDRQLTDITEKRRSLNGKANGGGPEVRIQTGAGSIRIH
jgi:DUF4097 and DUF4098 domain-containing protein YvlB